MPQLCLLKFDNVDLFNVSIMSPATQPKITIQTRFSLFEGGSSIGMRIRNKCIHTFGTASVVFIY